MFFSYMLLLFLLGTSVNAQWVKFTVEGLDLEQEKNTKWYRLERPKGKGWDNARDNDAIQINEDRSVTLFTLGKNGNALATVSCNKLRVSNSYFMEGVWGAVPNADMSIDHRNRELHCSTTEASGFKCHVQTAKTPESTGTTSTSPPPGYIGDKYSWYRITSGGDINDVIWDLRSNALPKYGVLDQFGTAKAIRKRIEIDHMVGTFRLLPSMDVLLEHRRVQLTVSATKEATGGKKFGFFGGPKMKQVLHYQFTE